MGSNDIYKSKLRIFKNLPEEVEISSIEPITLTEEEHIEQKLELTAITETTRHKPEPQNKSGADGYAFFDFNKSTLTNTAKTKLNTVLERLKSDSSLNIELVGHADYIDEEDFNQQLSEKRAASAANYLISKGIASHRITTSGFGELLPISNNESDIGRRLNRRVEIYFISQSQ
jgi:outer membrane protein OmpA-like peptidoglycan-associated protein